LVLLVVILALGSSLDLCGTDSSCPVGFEKRGGKASRLGMREEGLPSGL